MKTEQLKMLAGELYDPMDLFAAGNPCRVVREIKE